MVSKTTLNIDAQLLARARALAAKNGTTLTAVVEDALRAQLAARPTSAAEFRLLLPRVEGTAPPRVDVADRDALFDLMDRDR